MFQVPPAELERILQSHKEIADAAVIPYVSRTTNTDFCFWSLNNTEFIVIFIFLHHAAFSIFVS